MPRSIDPCDSVVDELAELQPLDGYLLATRVVAYKKGIWFQDHWRTHKQPLSAGGMGPSQPILRVQGFK